MKYLTTLLLMLMPVAAATAMPAQPLFGTQRFTPNTVHTVTGPLIQLQTTGGSILSFQQGARFSIDDSGMVTLTSGNLRVGPVGNAPLTLNLPQGPVTVAPLTALTVTVQNAQTTGRIYQGNLEADGRTFTTGQGFLLNNSGVHGTFTPAPAQAPAILNLASLEPAAGPTTSTPPTNNNQPILRTANRTITNPTPNTPQPETQSPAETTPPATTPEPIITPPETQPEPITEQPAPEPETTPTPQPEPEATPPATEQPIPPAPEPDPTPQPDPEPEAPTEPTPQPEPDPQPQAEIPTPLSRAGLYAAFSSPIPGDTNASSGAFLMSQYANGTQTLDATESRYLYSLSSTKFNRGSALNLDTASHSNNNTVTSGLGRWVGGELVAITTAGITTNASLIPNTTAVTTQTEDGETTTLHPNSLHYIWGETPSAVPTSGQITYNLFSATQPTYTGSSGNLLSSEGAVFNGNLAINFAPTPGGTVGSYHFNGTVAMPEVTQTATGPQTETRIYSFTTEPDGARLTTTMNNNNVLSVNAPTGALACPSGCTGTVNVAGFGAGMKDAGALYNINPTAATGITGAALFTSAPTAP